MEDIIGGHIWFRPDLHLPLFGGIRHVINKPFGWCVVPSSGTGEAYLSYSLAP